jgi:hypothetical protein
LLSVFPVGRIGSESEPPNLATETNATRSPRSARNPPSTARIRLCPSPKTPRKRGSIWDDRGQRLQRLRNRGRLGGADSLVRNRLWRPGALLSREDTGKSSNSSRPERPGQARQARFGPRGANCPGSGNSGVVLEIGRRARGVRRYRRRARASAPLSTPPRLSRGEYVPACHSHSHRGSERLYISGEML